MKDKVPTVVSLAKDALAVQDACNLSGVAHGFARAMTGLLALGLSTDQANTHFVAVLWADKIAHLTGTQSIGNDAVWHAHRQAVSVIMEDDREMLTRSVD